VSTIRRLADGLYEEVVTGGLARALELAAHERHIEAPELGDDAHVALARLLRGQIERAFADVGGSGDDKLERQLKLAEELLGVLERHRLIDSDQQIARPARELRGVFPDPAVRPRRPESPLATTTLLTLGQGEPRIGHELACEIDSADRVDALVSFVTKGGVRVLREAIDRLVLRHRPGEPPVFRLMTTTYTGATEAAAVEELARLPGVEVRVSYDGRRTRLHAKAWLFHRQSGLTTAYVGSANLSSPALTSGLEWMVKLTSSDLPHVIAKFSGAFESLWADPEFQRFDAESAADRERLRGALGAASKSDEAAQLTFFTIRPYEFQEEILDRLRAEREIHGRRRNLVVAATGTGKTVIAAFDYARRMGASGLRPRLLFLAHRRELLVQARDTSTTPVDSVGSSRFSTGMLPAPRSSFASPSCSAIRSSTSRTDSWQPRQLAAGSAIGRPRAMSCASSWACWASGSVLRHRSSPWPTGRSCCTATTCAGRSSRHAATGRRPRRPRSSKASCA
jgi:HKD family nuclease